MKRNTPIIFFFTLLIFCNGIAQNPQQPNPNTNLIQALTPWVYNDWNIIYPPPTSNGLSSIFFLNNTDGIAVGASGTVLKTFNQGTNWFNFSVNKNYNLFDVHFPTHDTGYSVGQEILTGKSVVIKTTNSGLNWINVSPTFSINLASVNFISKNYGFACGAFGSIFRTFNGGLNWTKVNPTTVNLNSVFFCDSLIGYATGNSGVILKTNDGGSNWTAQSTGVAGNLSQIFFINQFVGFAVGGGVILKTTNGGNTWTMQYNNFSLSLKSVFFQSPTTGFAVDFWGQILKSVDAGSSWSIVYTNITNASRMFKITGSPNNSFYVACTDGLIYKSTNGGSSVSFQSRTASKEYLFSVSFADTNKAVAVGSNGNILKIENSGALITAISSSITTDLNSVHFPVKDTGYATGLGKIYKTTDGGGTWNLLYNTVSYNFSSVNFLNSKYGFVVGHGGIILKTTDGGINWVQSVSNTTLSLSAVQIIDQNTSFIVGGLNAFSMPDSCLILKTVNAGGNWQIQKKNNQGILNSLFFTSADTGYTCGKYGTIYHTFDSGLTWQAHPNVANGVLFNINFATKQNGYCGGQDGVMLTTSDYGNSWTQILSSTTNYLNSFTFNKNGLGYGVGSSNTVIKEGLTGKISSYTVCAVSQTVYAASIGGTYPYTYTWNNGGASYSIAVSPTVSSTYNYTVTDANNLSTHGAINFSVSSFPVIAAASGSICSGKSFTLAPSGASSYTFSSGNPVVTPSTTTTYSVIGSNITGCVSQTPALVTITVNPTPTITAANSTICSGASYTIAPTGASTYTYLNGGPVVSPTASATYSVKGSSNAGCTNSLSTIVTVNVKPSPTVTAASGSICAGQTFTIFPSGASSFTYSSGSSVVSPTTTTSYSVSGTSTAGCNSSTPVIVTVIVEPTPTLSLNSGSVCSGSTFTFFPSGANTYTFSSGSAVVSPTTTTTYSVTGTSTAGCTSTTPAITTISVEPNPTITVNNAIICSGQSFTILPNGASTYTFSSGSPIVSPTINSTYSVTGTSSAGCTSSVSAISSVSVNPLPNLNISTSNSLICINQSATLSVSGANTYTWNTTSNANSIVVSPTIHTTYSVNATDNNGCENSAVITQSVSSCTGINNISASLEKNIRLFPNPTSSVIKIETSFSEYTVELYSAIGQLVLHDSNPTQLDLSQQSAGLYFIKIRAVNSCATFKVIKQ